MVKLEIENECISEYVGEMRKNYTRGNEVHKEKRMVHKVNTS